MPNIVTTLKESKKARRNAFIFAAVTVGAIATAVVLSKLKDNSVDVLVLSPVAEAAADAITE